MSDAESERDDERPEDLARTWLHAWDTHDLSLLRLTPDFVHTSPFGRIEGADEYLRIVEPMSRKTVSKIIVKDVIGGGNKAAIAYDLETPKGTVEACDWIYVEGGRIREVNSYYDSIVNRAALAEE